PDRDHLPCKTCRLLGRRDSDRLRRPHARRVQDEPADRARGDLAGAAAEVRRRVRDVTDDTFDAEGLRADGVVLVDFWAPWCGPCKSIEPALVELTEDSAATLVRIDIDANPRTASRFGVLSLPTVMLFVDGEPRETVYGARPKRHFAKVFAQHF